MKQEGKKKYDVQSDNRGFSFVEILVSIVIFALIGTPLLTHIITTYKVNAKSGRIQQETFLTQNILEDIKGKSFLEIQEEYQDTSNHTSIDGEIYYMAKKNVTYGKKKYDILLTFDATPYRVGNPSDPYGEKIGYNTFQMPIIADINIPKNVLAIESYETGLAVATLYSNHISYVYEQRELHKEQPGITVNEYSASDIQAQLTKQMKISINKEEEDYVIKVEFDYSCPDIAGCGSESYVVTDKVTSIIGDIYVFYYPTYRDQLLVMKDNFLTEDIDIYVVKQESDTLINSIPESLVETLPLGIHLYSNVSFGINSNPLVKKEPSKNRIYDVTVEVYPAGTNFNEEELSVRFYTTKEE